MNACEICGDEVRRRTKHGGPFHRTCSDECHAERERRQRRRVLNLDREDAWEAAVGQLLDELFPNGLTDDCPARAVA